MQSLLPKLRIVNEPKRELCGAPDYIASRKDGMPVFYIEAKDIGDNDLDGRNLHGHKEQFTRYKQALDYIYAVLHSPSYREHYKEFLKIDFPRIPYPTDWEKFRDLTEKGEELRQLHLMEDLPNQTGISFPVAGTLQVDCYRWAENRVYINSEQYFDGVPESAWNFFIGGYQSAQKWLKDRKGMTLSFEDVKHYQRIIYVLQQTERIMQEIDEITKTA